MSHIHTTAEAPGLEELFGEPISVYTDAQALDDGELADLTEFTRIRFQGLPVNRMTRHLFDDLAPFVEAEAAAFAGSFGRALASILTTKCRLAAQSPENTGEVGDIVRIPPNLWLVRNELDG